MEKFWKFLNSAFISALISGLLLMLINSSIIKRDSENNTQNLQNLSQIEKLSDSIESLQKFKEYAEKYIIENKLPIPQKTEEKKVGDWKRLLDFSYGKKNDKHFVKKYASSMNDEVPFYVEVNSVKSHQSKISILRKNLSVLKTEVLTKKGHYEFKYDKNEFRLNLIDIRPVGLFGTLAAFFTIDVLIEK